ncbi:aminotransferase [bacterium M00.F.Ca.ET.194.01.1.1]|nr:aminotransferase [bacterium M00.F.Ca.ET.194.01.1.1]TGS52643.1 aminotransferase [bacterium M00.F.Ca.ET.179.01.1.1]TGV44499.1 aminotransferase [bacterium M00.F.Ca.ET.168.01.1.1]
MSKPSPNILVSRLPVPPIPSVVAWGRSYDGAHGGVIDLSQAVPGYPTHPEMLRLLGEAAACKDMTGYGAIEGEYLLREVYAGHMSERYGARICPENILITAGCNQAFMATIIALAAPGTRVALTNPFYFNHDTTLSMLGIERVLVACDRKNGFLPELASVEAALSGGAKVLALVSPNNPTGAVYPPDLLSAIYNLCRRYNAWLILDETYRDFLTEAPRGPHGLLSEHDWHDRLVLLYSFSKSLCIPGHRLGAITSSPNLVGEITKVMDNIQICAPRAAQHAVAQALPELSEWRFRNMLEIDRRAQALKRVFDALSGWEIASIGAYFAFVRHPYSEEKAMTVAERLATTAGVVTIPGTIFGAGNDSYLRFAFANVDEDSISRLADRLVYA